MDATQELLVVVHTLQVGPGHDEVRVSVIKPVCPTGHESDWVCNGRGVQEGAGIGVVPSLGGMTGEFGDTTPIGEVIVPMGSVAGEAGAGGIYGFGLVGLEGVTLPVMHDRLIAARVLGPAAPYPVVAALPDDMMLFFFCHCCTAACVSLPK
jgi:hypothetical protein